MLDEQQFRGVADAALSTLNRALAAAADRYGFESDMNSGALTVEFEDPPAKFVVSPNTPVRQIWVSAHSRSFKLDWDAAQSLFILPATGQTLHQLLGAHISEHLGEEVAL
jgi:CyaY protein